jgi:hypothetical protein
MRQVFLLGGHPRSIHLNRFDAMRFSTTSIVVISAVFPALALGASAAPESAWFWDMVIALIVLLAALASAALPIAAFRNWTNRWRWGALFPFAVLTVWSSIIIASKLIDPLAHRLWQLELFAWAMLNMIYMVALMTTKRIFEKADAEAADADKSEA